VDRVPAAEAASQTTLRFTVSDSGIGIPAEKQDEIFGAFVQADASTTRRFGGTGLGLTISARLVELMGGQISVVSEPGSGSRFTFVITLELQSHPAVRPAPTGTLRGLRVLVVDDNAVNRAILSEVLTNWDMHPVAVEDAGRGLTALRLAADEGRPFRLVLSDVQMPGTDGFTFAQQVAEDPRLADAKVMMLTSAGMHGGQQPSAANRIVAQLLKPVKQSDLLDAIVNAFDTVVAASGSPTDVASAVRREIDASGSSDYVASSFGRKADDTQSAQARPLRILVAEDNATNQKLVLTLLEQEGHHVVLTWNGREAALKARQERFDLILMDLQMPEMGGLGATAAIREYEETTGGHVPIVAMTAHVMPGDRERALAAGMDGYVSKPLRPDQLLSAIASVVPESRVLEPPAPQEDVPAEGLDAAVDAAALLRNFGGRKQLVADVATVFLADAPEMLNALRAANTTGNASAIAAAAHAIKGAAGLFSSGPAFQAARLLEQEARRGDLAGVDEHGQALEREVGQLIGSLHRIVETLRAGS
jgi:two-component system, sensor histidine kinase and response regulator